MASFSPPSMAFSSPSRLTPSHLSVSSPSATTSTTRAAPPTITLQLHPSIALGPFVLGSTVYTTLRYLRHTSPHYSHNQGRNQQGHGHLALAAATDLQGPTLFPRVDFAFDADEPRDGLVVVKPDQRISCVFDAGRLRVVLVSLGGDEQGGDDGGGSSMEGETNTLGDKGESYRRRVEVLWKGKLIHFDGGQRSRTHPTGTTTISRGDVQQLFGPTYPARRYTSTDGLHDYLPLSNAGSKKTSSPPERRTTGSPPPEDRWILSYDGFSFVFKAEGQDRNELGKNAKPIALVLHIGEDALNPGEASWPKALPTQSPSFLVPGAKRNTSSSGSSSSSNISSYINDISNEGDGMQSVALAAQIPNTASYDGLWKDAMLAHAGVLIEEAIIRPHQGIILRLLRPPDDTNSLSASPERWNLQLKLHETTLQDALLELGTPERKWVKGETAVQSNSDAEGLQGDQVEFDTSPAPPTFYSYPSLGLDLLFGPPPADQSGAERVEEDSYLIPLLRKIVVHSDVPGSATWGRFELVNWKIEDPRAGKGHSGEGGGVIAKSSSSSSAATKKSSKVATTIAATKSGGKQSPVPPASESEADNGTGKGEKIGYFDWRTDLPTLYSHLSSSTSSTSSSSSSSSTSSNPSTAPRQFLDLDRSTSTEFRSLLTLDVRTTLRGFPGLVAEVLNLPIGGSEAEVKTGTEGEEKRGVVVAWTII